MVSIGHQSYIIINSVLFLCALDTPGQITGPMTSTTITHKQRCLQPALPSVWFIISIKCAKWVSFFLFIHKQEQKRIHPILTNNVTPFLSSRIKIPNKEFVLLT